MAWFAARTVSVNTSAPCASQDGRRQLAEQFVLAARLRHDLAPLGERVEILARGAPVGTGVALGEMRDRGEEVAERLERHAADETEVMTRAHESLLRRGVLGPFVNRQVDADERHPRRRAHAVVDRLLEAVAVADAPEVRQEQLVHRVVAAFERRGQAEPFVVLAEHRASERPAAEAVTLVRDEQATDPARRYRLVRGSRVAGRDEHVAGCRVGPCRCRPTARSELRAIRP